MKSFYRLRIFILSFLMVIAFSIPASAVEYHLKLTGGSNTWLGAQLFADGTVGAPSISFSADTDTGLFRSGTDALVFTSGGVEGARFVEAGSITALHFPEITTPTPVASYGAIYPKADNNLYFQDGAGTEHLLGGAIGKTKSYSHASGSTGIHYMGGAYIAPAADTDLTQASLTQTLGTANGAYGAHAFAVSSAAGTTDGSDCVVTVSGTSITDGGVRSAADSEVVIADCTTESTDDYSETAKKWIGQVTYTLSSTAGSTFAHTFNYGFAKYEDFGNEDATIIGFELTGHAGANDSGYNITLMHHKATGWTYHASAFVPGSGNIVDMVTDYNTEVNLISGDNYAYKRTGLSTAIDSDGAEGVIIKIVTGAVNSVLHEDVHISFTQ